MITLSESETKVIMRCARADVSHYRVMRSADFPEDSVKPELVVETVRVLRDIEHTLQRHGGGHMTNNRRRGSRQAKEAPKGPLKKPRAVWFVTLMAFVLPGSGQVFNGAPARGVIFQFGMVMGAFITYQLTTPEISPLGRMAGGLLVYVFSIVDANGIAKLRVKAWERIEAGEPPRPRKGMTDEAAVEGRPRGARKKGVAAPARRKNRPAGRHPEGPGKPAGPQSGPDDPAEPGDGPGDAGRHRRARPARSPWLPSAHPAESGGPDCLRAA